MPPEFPSPDWFKKTDNFECFASGVSFRLIASVTSRIIEDEDPGTALEAEIERCAHNMREDGIPAPVIRDFKASYDLPDRRTEFLAPCIENARLLRAENAVQARRRRAKPAV